MFTLSSPDFKDGERLALKNAGNNKANPNCVGENVSPTLNWTNLEPTALQPGLTRDELVKALDGHAKAATGLIGTFSKP